MVYIFIQNAYADKILLDGKGSQIMFNGSNGDTKSQLSGILTEPLNPSDVLIKKPENLSFLRGVKLTPPPQARWGKNPGVPCFFRDYPLSFLCINHVYH